MWFVPLVAQDSINTSYYWESIKESEKQMLNCSLSYYQWIIFAKSTTRLQIWMWKKKILF